MTLGGDSSKAAIARSSDIQVGIDWFCITHVADGGSVGITHVVDLWLSACSDGWGFTASVDFDHQESGWPLDFPQCFISCSILSAIFLSVFYFFCLEFFILPARGFEPARSWISGELLNHCASSVPGPITAVFPLVVKRRSCLPQLDPLKHGRSFAVSWPYFWSFSCTGTSLVWTSFLLAEYMKYCTRI